MSLRCASIVRNLSGGVCMPIRILSGSAAALDAQSSPRRRTTSAAPRRAMRFIALSMCGRRAHTDADRAAHAGAAEAAIAAGILGEILLMIVLGVVEGLRILDFGCDRRMARFAELFCVG